MAPRDRESSEEGQAALEYVGLVAVVAIVLTGLAVLVPRPAEKMLSVVELAICTGLGDACEIGGEESLAFEPCPVERTATSTDLHATVLSVQAARGESEVVEELSDGSATVTLGDRSGLGVEGGVGAGVSTDGGGRAARGEASAGLELGTGSGYRFAGMGDALRFLAAHRASRDAGGGLPGCVLCGVLGLEQGPPDDPDFSFLEGGGTMRAGAGVAAGGVNADAGAVASGAFGRRVDHRSGEVTRYYRVRGEVRGDLGGPLSMSGEAGAQAVLEYTTSVEDSPLDLTVRGAREVAGGLGSALRGSRAGAARGGAAGVAAGGDRMVEQVASLDLTDRRNRRAAMRLIEALGPPADPLALPGRLGALHRRLERAGSFEERVFSTSVHGTELAGDAALGVKLGGGVAGRATEQTLTGARTRPAGATLFLDRADCFG